MHAVVVCRQERCKWNETHSHAHTHSFILNLVDGRLFVSFHFSVRFVWFFYRVNWRNMFNDEAKIHMSHAWKPHESPRYSMLYYMSNYRPYQYQRAHISACGESLNKRPFTNSRQFLSKQQWNHTHTHTVTHFIFCLHQFFGVQVFAHCYDQKITSICHTDLMLL